MKNEKKMLSKKNEFAKPKNGLLETKIHICKSKTWNFSFSKIPFF
jgi:hypothetical protein